MHGKHGRTELNVKVDRIETLGSFVLAGKEPKREPEWNLQKYTRDDIFMMEKIKVYCRFLNDRN